MGLTDMKRALITGINGFAGSHLADLLLQLGWKVHGTVRSFRSDLNNLDDARALHPNKMVLHACDILDQKAVDEAISAAKPTHIFHLAAQSYVPASWQAPGATLDVNVKGTLHLLEAMRRLAPNAKMQVAGTSEEYGVVTPSECPITEDQPLRPMSPYGVSKVAADVLTRQYVASYGLRCVVTRAFNHSGARRGKVFAESDWARQIAQAEANGDARVVVRHGNLSAIRDMTDVRDIVRGYIAACDRGTSGMVYNLCSGRSQSPTMRDILQRLANRSVIGVVLEKDEARMRPSDVPRLIGDNARAKRDLKWSPQIPLASALESLLLYWRSVLHATGPKK